MILQEQLKNFSIYTNKKLLIIMLLGFASGLPRLLTLSTLSIWLFEMGLSKTTIGLFTLVGLSYSLKFLWAPFIDSLKIPFFTNYLGRRRSWIILTQILLISSLIFLGYSNPSVDLRLTVLAAVLVAFFSASQDIVIDAFRVESLEKELYGAGAGMYVFGYRIGMLVAGAGALYLATFYEWSIVYILMSLLILIGSFAILFASEPEKNSLIDTQKKKNIFHWFNDSVINPFRDFMKKGNWKIIILFVVLYKFGDALVSVMANPFYLEMEFSKIEIANVSKFFGFIATVTGALIGGVFVKQSGIFKSLLACGILQMLSNLFYAIQAFIGYNIGFLIVTIGFMDLASGMGTAAFIAYLSNLCNIRYTATQYALLSSFASLGLTFLSSPAGYLVVTVGWIPFFIFTSIAAIPGIYFLIILKKKNSQF